jgi:hypothetical protein
VWYKKGIEYGLNASRNIFFYGTVLRHENSEKEKEQSDSDYQTDAISANRNLLSTHFTEFHKYRLEWQTGEEGYIRW